MAPNVSRWMKYAKARLDAAVRSGNSELDRREAELEARRADKPWMRDDGENPTFDQVRARIEAEAERQGVTPHRGVPDRPEPAATPTPPAAPARPEPVDAERPDPDPAGSDATDPKGAAPKEADGKATDGTETDGTETDAPAPTDPAPADRPPADPEAGGGASTPTGGSAPSGPAPRSPQEVAEDAEREMARLELEERQRASAERLDQIRRELGVDPAGPGDADG